MIKRVKATEVTGEQWAERVQEGTATLFGMSGHLANREAEVRNGKGNGYFSFTVFASGNYAVITLPIYPA